jgi:rod shape-determining protein MreC
MSRNKSENAHLRSILSEYTKKSTILQHFDTNYKYEFTFIPAHVVYNSIDKRNNYLTINVGKKHGIEPRMGVISGNGVVGIVKSVSENFAIVISVLNSDFKLNAKVRESGEVGSVIWDGQFYRNVILTDIPNRVSIKEGSHVVVGPYSRIFPEGFPIGTIQRISLNKGEAFFDIHVKLNNDLKNNTSVYVIKKLNLKEQEELEKEIEQ